MLVLQVLYPATTLTSVQLLVCHQVTLSAVGASALNGGPSLASTASPDALVTVTVSSSNPYHVCWYGDHAGVAALALIVIPLYVIGLPVLTLWWLWLDPWVATEVRRVTSASGGAAYAQQSIGVGDGAGSDSNAPPSSLDLAKHPVAFDVVSNPANESESVSSARPDPLLGVF